MDKQKFDSIIEDIRKRATDRGGYILHDQINEMLGDETDYELIERIYDKLGELQIDYYDSEDEAAEKISRRKRKEKKKAAPTTGTIRSIGRLRCRVTTGGTRSMSRR